MQLKLTFLTCNNLYFSFCIVVNLPKVTLQPLSKTITLRVNDVNISLSCGAKGDNLLYVWERSNATVPSNTNGNNTSTLQFYLLSPENAGKYRCKVSNGTGIGYSDYAVLQIHGWYFFLLLM